MVTTPPTAKAGSHYSKHIKETQNMTNETRSLHYEVLQILKKASISYDPLLPIRIKTISAVNRLHTADHAFIGIAISPGRINVLLRPKTFLVETLALDQHRFITTWSIVVMDAAGDLRLVEDITANDGDPSGAQRFVDQVADLLDEQAAHNDRGIPKGSAIRNTLDTATRQIATRPGPEWAGWVNYILEALQDRADGEDYGNMLTELSLAIEVRQLEGTWL